MRVIDLNEARNAVIRLSKRNRRYRDQLANERRIRNLRALLRDRDPDAYGGVSEEDRLLQALPLRAISATLLRPIRRIPRAKGRQSLAEARKP